MIGALFDVVLFVVLLTGVFIWGGVAAVGVARRMGGERCSECGRLKVPT